MSLIEKRIKEGWWRKKKPDIDLEKIPLDKLIRDKVTKVRGEDGVLYRILIKSFSDVVTENDIEIERV